jgi:transcriptional regulator with XRE-family HTH domain
VSLLSKINLIKKLKESKKARDAYVYEHVRNGIPFQIRAMRKENEWSQQDLAEAAKTSRTVITRIEDPNYGKLSLKTLLAIASAFNVALLVKFVPFSRLLKEYEDVSWQALSAESVTHKLEAARLSAWADGASDAFGTVKTESGDIASIRDVDRKPNYAARGGAITPPRATVSAATR